MALYAVTAGPVAPAHVPYTLFTAVRYRALVTGPPNVLAIEIALLEPSNHSRSIVSSANGARSPGVKLALLPSNITLVMS